MKGVGGGMSPSLHMLKDGLFPTSALSLRDTNARFVTALRRFNHNELRLRFNVLRCKQ